MGSNKYTIDAQKFADMVKNHNATIKHDSGLYRHVVCAIPGTMMESFQIMTWPGHLSIFGDMGTYVFQRTEDMFSFFRDAEHKNRINLGYWHEKLDAVDRHSLSKEFDIDKFKNNVKEHVVDHLDIDSYDEMPEDKKEDIERLLNSSDEYEAVAAIRDFEADWINFYDFWENDCKEYTNKYVFACYAIVWAIEQYDKLRAEGKGHTLSLHESGKAVQTNTKLI